jgi:hypothetical protein
MRGFTRQHRFTLIVAFAMVFSAYAQGINLKVNCGGREHCPRSMVL